MSLSDWRLPLFGGSAYSLWLKPASLLLSEHHIESCHCALGQQADAQSSEVFSVGSCYEAAGETAYKTTFRKAHAIIENGFKVMK